MILNVFFQMFSPRLGFLQSTNKSTEEHKVNHQTSATVWGENKFLCPAPCADSHSWHWRATATHQSPHWGFLKYACASDNHLEISQATRKWIKDSSSPACYVCVRQVNSLIRPRQGQSSGASCWQCCVGYERSPEEQTPSATALFFQAAPAVFSGLSSCFSVAVSFSKMLKSLKMPHHHYSEWSTCLCVQKTTSGYAQGSKKYTSDLLGQYSLCTQLWMPTGILSGMPGTSREGEGKVGHFILRRADWCRCSSSAPLTFLRPELLSVTCTAQNLRSPLLLLPFIHKAGT